MHICFPTRKDLDYLGPEFRWKVQASEPLSCRKPLYLRSSGAFRNHLAVDDRRGFTPHARPTMSGCKRKASKPDGSLPWYVLYYVDDALAVSLD
jgi:hypothetical protein